MKYFVIMIVLVGFTVTAFAMPSFDSQEIFDFSDTIAVGKVVYVNSTFSPTHNLYHIQVEKFLKNPHDSEIIMAIGQNITSSISGTQIFHVNDRALFFLTNPHVGYDVHSNILSIHPTTKLVESEWDACDIFENDLSQEHWVLGGVDSRPKIFQEGNPNIEDVKNNKPVTISYDVSNISNTTKVIDFDGVLSRSNGTAFQTMSSMAQNVVLEPCTVYKTIEWRFTPSMTGSYLFEINSDSGGYGLGFTVKESVDSPLKQFKSGISFNEIQCQENLVLIHKYDDSPACVTSETIPKLVAREWGISDNWIKISNANKAVHYELNDAVILYINAYSEYTNPSLPEEKMQTWLQIKLESTQDGSMQITLPRDLIDAKIGNTDDTFFVLLDGTETQYQETKTNSERILDIHFPAKTDIVEILGYGYHNPELSTFYNRIPLEPVVNEDGTVSANNKPYTWYDIKGIKQIYKVGEPISFTETIQGYANPCVSPHYEILDGNTLETVWQYKIVYPCPFIKDPQQFKKINIIPNENIPSPILNQTGSYILRSYHSYSDEFTAIGFSVVDESIGENEN